MKKEMLINVLQPEECRIAIVEDGVLEELYVERTSHESYVGNIYKGRIVNIEPSIQAAFVDFGVGRNGFLHVSDVDPQYYRNREGRNGGRGDQLPDILNLPDVRLIQEEELSAMEDDDSAAETASVSTEQKHSDSAESSQQPLEASEPFAEDEPLERLDAEGPADTFGDEGPPSLPTSFRRTSDHDSRRSTENRKGQNSSRPATRREEARSEKELAGDSGSITTTPSEAAKSANFLSREDTALQEPVGAVEEADDRADVMEAHAAVEEGEALPRPGRARTRGRRSGGRANNFRAKPPIQDIFRRGQEVLVQVIKEGIGTKGPTLSTYISIPGRYLVLMPGLNRIGVSRKIVDEEQRRKLREILSELQPPKGLGFIIRTAGLDRTKKELQRDLAYLTRLWKVVVRRIKKLRAPASIYQESDMITRTIRDVFTSEIETIWVDEPRAYEHAKEFLQIVMPRYANRIQLYTDSEPLFHRYGIEEEIQRIHQRRVPLPNGGSLVIDQTEALVAIDVNSGNFRADNNAEETAYRINLQAAKEIARQLRLRDLGGVIVNDFIDMREERHRREVERALREAVKRDRARTKILKISAFGIIEMTRQRIRPSLKRSVFEDCPACNGTGQVKTVESMSIEVMRMLQLAGHRSDIARVQIRVAEPVAHYLLNKKRREIAQLEESGKMSVTIIGGSSLYPETLEILCHDSNGNEVKLLPCPAPTVRKPNGK
ncbi:MAG: Rne/Rng family ribonuclease [Gemmatales bacterium]|nr:Rne/Rng family ribonuclease [Gemmatales bacterium]MDW8386648.1 Rne/Rng family ribonuclease [Gemmatales bacterium]